MKIRQIARNLEAWAPPSLAESYDNVGLLVGDPEAEATGVLINLDVTEALIDEAVARGLNMVVTHHPIWFSAIKRLTGENYVSRIIIKAIKENVALYACHTNLDSVRTGVNRMIGERMGIADMRMLSGKKEQLQKWVVRLAAPAAEAAKALEAVGARQLEVAGEGWSFVLPVYARGAALGALRGLNGGADPVFHTLPTLETDMEVGAGMVGDLPQPLSKADFLAMVRERFGCGGIRYADAPKATVQRVAWCGGAGSFLISNAIGAGADALVTADITYHKFFDADDRLLLLDIGHHESEQFTSRLLHDHLSKSFPTFAIRLSEINTNPVKYC